jgi:hypothetical protein
MNFIETIWMHPTKDIIIIVPVIAHVKKSFFYEWVKKNGFIMIGEI